MDAHRAPRVSRGNPVHRSPGLRRRQRIPKHTLQNGRHILPLKETDEVHVPCRFTQQQLVAQPRKSLDEPRLNGLVLSHRGGTFGLDGSGLDGGERGCVELGFGILKAKGFDPGLGFGLESGNRGLDLCALCLQLCSLDERFTLSHELGLAQLPRTSIA